MALDSYPYPFFRCDEPGCQRASSPQPSLEGAIGWARNMGWLIDRHRALCPCCRPERLPPDAEQKPINWASRYVGD